MQYKPFRSTFRWKIKYHMNMVPSDVVLSQTYLKTIGFQFNAFTTEALRGKWEKKNPVIHFLSLI